LANSLLRPPTNSRSTAKEAIGEANEDAPMLHRPPGARKNTAAELQYRVAKPVAI